MKFSSGTDQNKFMLRIECITKSNIRPVKDKSIFFS